MKASIHPDYHRVLFVDTTTGDEWTSRSTRRSSERRDVGGELADVIRLDISRHSHPVWTGVVRHIDRAGRVERFRTPFGRA